MIMRRCDRYVLREMSGPFLISLFGLLLFILLNLILSLSDLMVDRGVGVDTLLRLLLFKMPSLLVLALPVTGLFATFLGLGRLIHDREVMALEAAGVSLRRILLPLLVAALLLGGVDFMIYNWAVPMSEHAYQQELRRVIFRQGVPHIQANTFFRGPEGQFFYVRRYDEEDGTLRDILVYDIEGKLFPQAETAITILTAKKGHWQERTWDLSDGRVYGYSREGELVFTGKFDRLEVPLDKSAADFFVRSRTPAEMGIGELLSRIQVLRESGLSAFDLIVEVHLKAAIPFATLVFVLFGGTTGLIFGWRSRAVGVVISLLLVGLFQGSLLWTQTLGRRGIIPPSVASWIPDIIFGVVGALLFLRLDRLTSRQLWTRLRNLFTFVGILLFVAFPTKSDQLPVQIDCDELFVSADRTFMSAKGDALVSFVDTLLSADEIVLTEVEDGSWQIDASGQVRLVVEEGLSLTGDSLSTLLVLSEGELVARQAEASGFTGSSPFVNSVGESHQLYYQGAEGKIEFGEEGEVSSIEVREGKLTTCDCCNRSMHEQPYSIEAGRLIVYPDRLLVAFNLTVDSLGVPVFWLPAYVQPLEETIESPLFPAIGRSGLRGWFLKWNFPFYIDEENYGTVLFDYFSRFVEVGLGAILHYSFGVHSGRVELYRLPAKVGEGVVDFSLNHTSVIAEGWRMSGSLDYSRLGERTDVSFAFSLDGELREWGVHLALARSQDEDGELIYVTERLPDLTLSGKRIEAEGFYLSPRLELGRLREWEVDEGGAGVLTESLRFDGSLRAAKKSFLLGGFSFSPSGSIRLTSYQMEEESSTRAAISLSMSATYPGMDLSYSYVKALGESPFRSDKLESLNRFGWGLFRGDPLSLNVEGSIDLEPMDLRPVLITVRFVGPYSSLAVLTRYDLSDAQVEEIELGGHWRSENSSTRWEIPYYPEDNRLGQFAFEIRSSAEKSELTSTGRFDPIAGRLTEAAVGLEVVSEDGWGVDLGGAYDSDSVGIVEPRLGLFRDMCDCMRVGVEHRMKQTWLYISVLAFPDAILRYAPTEAELEFGQ